MKIESALDRDRGGRITGIRRTSSSKPERRVAFPQVIFHAAAGWFLIGCIGLLWAVVFDAGTSTLQIALAAWATLFLLPATIVGIIAYRMDEQDSTPPHPRLRIRPKAVDRGQPWRDR
jgi:hypothetical protein